MTEHETDYNVDTLMTSLTGRFVLRLRQAAEHVDQPTLLRLRAAPHAAARDRVDLLRRAVARGGDLADELRVAVVDDGLDHGPGIRILGIWY